MIEGVLQLLEGLSRRTGMYIQAVDIYNLQSYLHGLEAGCSLGGLTITREVYAAAACGAGWKQRATGIVWHMEAKGLSAEAIMREMTVAQSRPEAFRRAAARPGLTHTGAVAAWPEKGKRWVIVETRPSARQERQR